MYQSSTVPPPCNRAALFSDLFTVFSDLWYIYVMLSPSKCSCIALLPGNDAGLRREDGEQCRGGRGHMSMTDGSGPIWMAGEEVTSSASEQKL